MMRRIGGMLAAMLLLTVPAAAQDPDIVAVITAPADGAQLFGSVNILGSAGHPTAFDYFTLEYNDLGDPSAPWLLAQPEVRQQVQNGILGTWSTIAVPDGNYRIRLRVFLQDGQTGEFVVSNLRVANSLPTPVPTAASGGEEPLPAVPTLGPTPTSPVIQPPSSNPDISGLPGADSSDTSASLSETVTSRPARKKTQINLDRVQGAFCNGVYLTLVLFAAMLGYSLVRRRVRPLARRWSSQDQWNGDQ